MSTRREHIERKAARHHGVILRRDALEAGMNPRQIKRRVERRQWIPGPTAGVYLLASFADNPASVLRAACQALDGVPWAQSAVGWWELAPHPQRPVVAIRGRRSSAAVHVVRPRDFNHVVLTRRYGIEVPTVESALATMAANTTAHGLHELLDEAVRRRLTTPKRIVDALERFAGQGRPGSAVIRQVLRTLRSESTVPLSQWGRRFADKLESSGFARPALEYRVLNADGELIAQVDAAYVGSRLAFELDSIAHHHNLAAFETDRIRDLRLARLGWRTIRVTWHQFTQCWDDVTDAVHALYPDCCRSG